MKNKSTRIRISSAIIGLALFLFCMVSCGKIPVESITLSLENTTLNVGTTHTIAYTVLPEDATDKTVLWTSSNDAVATVDTNGNIQAVSAGTCIITAVSGEVSSTLTLTIKKPVESLLFSETDMTVNLGNAAAVTCTVLPEDATDKTVTWISSDNSIATVNNVGVITAVGTGICSITATAEDQTASLNVTVKKPVEQVVLNKYEVDIKIEETFTFTCTVVPNDASNKTVTWTSSDNTVATVDGNGTITGVKAGTCTITAQADGKEVTANITVKEKGPDLKAIYDEYCSSTWAEIGNDGSYLSIDDNPYDWDDFYLETADAAIQEIHTAIGLPSSLYNDMCQTTWSMGRQQETFEKVGIKISWTYHPNKGLEITYKLLD